MIFTQWPLFYKKFQNPTVEKHVSTPHIRLAKVTKNPEKRTDGRTDGTRCFDLPTDVKSASRKIECKPFTKAYFPSIR